MTLKSRPMLLRIVLITSAFSISLLLFAIYFAASVGLHRKYDVAIGDIMLGIQAVAMTLGLLQIYLFLRQERRGQKWQKLLSYHTYFADWPSADRARELHQAMKQLGYEKALKGTGDAISGDAATKITNDAAISQVFKKYLDGFEQLAAAVNCGVVDEDYAFNVEATRLIRARNVFKPLIQTWQGENFRAYLELTKLADQWEAKRTSTAADWLRQRDELARSQGVRLGV